MIMPKKFWILGSVAIGLAVVLLIFPAGTWAASNVQPEIEKPRKLELVVGKSFALKIPGPVRMVDSLRVTIAAPEIADFLFLPQPSTKKRPRYIYLTGKKPGATNMTIWQNDKVLCVYDLDVAYDVSQLKQRLHDILPEEEDIRVFATQDSITISGMVSSTENLNEALVLAEAFAKDNIVNLLKVAGVHQVMLEVRVAEMSRNLLDRLGINFTAIRDSGNFAVTLLGGLSSFSMEDVGSMEETVPTYGIQYSDDVTGLFRTRSGQTQFTGIIDLLKGNGLIKILAEPTLIALSGQTASFLAGGEFPIPRMDDEGNVDVDFKPYGIELSFTPTVLSEKKIGINVVPLVSELDYPTGTTIGGAVVPGLLTRRASTTVELADGQSFAIAGLLKETTRENISKYPLLGDIPILGALFKSKSFQKQETELVIIVTPHLVKPLDMAKQSLPTDFYIEPDDAEFYLWGIFGKSHEKNPYVSAELDGDFGHIFSK